MTTRSALKGAAQAGVRMAEGAIDRFRYDILHKGEDADTVILTYAGYRAEGRLILRGRVVESWPRRFDVGDAPLAKLRNMLRLYESDEIPGVPLNVTVAGETHEVITDDEGYFSLLLDHKRDLPAATSWEEAEVTLQELGLTPCPARILAPSKAGGLAVISDIDDTVLETGATSLLKNWKRLLVQTPEEREAVPGAEELYAKLSADGSVPVFYVSSSPWNLYNYLERFMEAHGLPKGPMFLRDYGIDDAKFITGAHTDHKIETVKHLLSLYPERRFLLIGDDGQKDVDVYAAAAEMFPERVAGVFIRDAHGDGVSENHGKALDKLKAAGVEVYFGKTMNEAMAVAEAIGF